MALSHMVKTIPDLDLTLPFRGVTALGLALYMRHPDMVKALPGKASSVYVMFSQPKTNVDWFR